MMMMDTTPRRGGLDLDVRSSVMVMVPCYLSFPHHCDQVSSPDISPPLVAAALPRPNFDGERRLRRVFRPVSAFLGVRHVRRIVVLCLECAGIHRGRADFLRITSCSDCFGAARKDRRAREKGCIRTRAQARRVRWRASREFGVVRKTSRTRCLLPHYFGVKPVLALSPRPHTEYAKHPRDNPLCT